MIRLNDRWWKLSLLLFVIVFYIMIFSFCIMTLNNSDDVCICVYIFVYYNVKSIVDWLINNGWWCCWGLYDPQYPQLSLSSFSMVSGFLSFSEVFLDFSMVSFLHFSKISLIFPTLFSQKVFQIYCINFFHVPRFFPHLIFHTIFPQDILVGWLVPGFFPLFMGYILKRDFVCLFIYLFFFTLFPLSFFP